LASHVRSMSPYTFIWKSRVNERAGFVTSCAIAFCLAP
jgi:hypothetical protein